VLNSVNLLKKAETEILLAATAFLAGCKEKPRATPPPPMVEGAPDTQVEPQKLQRKGAGDE
jgi:hypothetical protein